VCFERVPDGASLFRHCVHPIVFTGGKTFAPEKMFYLKPKNSPNDVVSSVAWQKYAPTQDHIHGYGCRLAININNNKRKGGILRKKNRHIYCGAYHLSAARIRKLYNVDDPESPIDSAEVNHLIDSENPEIAHAEIRFSIKPETVNIDAAKTEIVARLWNLCCGPLPFICEYDHDIVSHPSEDLDPGPLGGYVDTRSRWSRIGDLVSFHVCQWIMRRLGRVPSSASQ
jgi:hypothetical protein